MQVFGGALAWWLYGIGHLASITPGCPYRIYNWLMLRSLRVQDWSGATGPWGKEVEHDT